MSLLAVGLNHRSAPLSLLERASMNAADISTMLQGFIASGHVQEAMVLATCNRVECYAEVDRFHAGVREVTDVLTKHIGIELPVLGQHLYIHYEDAAVEHLFTVAAGLDSMVMGEQQILGQLRAAYATATTEGVTGRAFHELCQRALRAGKRVQSETTISRASASVVSAALAEATTQVGSLAGKHALIIGAGAMGALAVTSLQREGVTNLVIANRTQERANQLAIRCNGRAVLLTDLAKELAQADIVVTCITANEPIITQDLAQWALSDRLDRPLLIVDLALPRNVAAGVADLPGITCVDLAALQNNVQQNIELNDVASAVDIVSAEVAAYLAWRQSISVVPTVAALRAKAASVINLELSKLDSKLPDLPTNVRDEIAQVVRRTVSTLLHGPTVRVKELAGKPGGDSYAAALQELFELDVTTTDSVLTPSGSVLRKKHGLAMENEDSLIETRLTAGDIEG